MSKIGLSSLFFVAITAFMIPSIIYANDTYQAVGIEIPSDISKKDVIHYNDEIKNKLYNKSFDKLRSNNIGFVIPFVFFTKNDKIINEGVYNKISNWPFLTLLFFNTSKWRILGS